MYPQFLAEARDEGLKPAEFSFKNSLAVEEVHFDLFNRALSALKEGRELVDEDIYVCPVCGNTVEGSVPDICPVCHVKGEKYKKIE
jgi:rubrerythrin